MTGHGDEVAVIAQRLIDATVQLHLIDAAGAHEVIIDGLRGRKPGRGAPRAEFAGVHQGEDALVAVLADRGLQDDAEILGRTTRDVVNGAAGSRGGRAVHVGRA
ncbi:hypothetical protein D3C87_1645310 [compost metagenome]